MIATLVQRFRETYRQLTYSTIHISRNTARYLPFLSKYWESIVIGIVAITLFVTLFHIALFTQGFLIGDSAFNRIVVTEIVDTQSLTYTDSLFGEDTLYLFYPKLFFIAAAFFDILFHPYGVEVFETFVYTLLTLSLLFLGKKIVGRSTYLLIVPFLLMRWPFWYYFNFYKAESLLFVFSMLFITTLLAYLNDKKIRWVILASIFLAAALGTKQTAFILLPLTAFFFALLFIQKDHKAIRTIATLILCTFVLTAPVLGLQFATTGTIGYYGTPLPLLHSLEVWLSDIFSLTAPNTERMLSYTLSTQLHYFLLEAESIINFFASITLNASAQTFIVSSIPLLLLALFIALKKKDIPILFLAVYIFLFLSVFFFKIHSYYYFYIVGLLASIYYTYLIKSISSYPRKILVSVMVLSILLLNIPPIVQGIGSQRPFIKSYQDMGQYAQQNFPHSSKALSNRCSEFMLYAQKPCRQIQSAMHNAQGAHDTENIKKYMRGYGFTHIFADKKFVHFNTQPNEYTFLSSQLLSALQSDTDFQEVYKSDDLILFSLSETDSS